ncbi:PD-(D/E)XK nuclease superfamily protein [Modicisalibacter xianhensis]|uniref:PD-(D/E)XK nuclease superfamily protein n=1 Tax=Modicisalibacter xianhensis TaxID=442341 RepID=A0A4R8FW22_9GAMM|nr:PD-(D/E)XK nuclease family protein [Halomonas xianhensis]TDX26781.1 PD-(D/E)XK nuclease superfamily protein [Halomonas xianhensis]
MNLTAMDADHFIEDMQRLISKPEFQSLSRYNQERNWLSYLHLKESHYCSILEWLLAPDEGHGLGDFFLKRMLAAANRTALADKDSDICLSITSRLESGTWLGIDELFTHSLSASLVSREIVSNEDAKRIDLLVVDPILQVVVAIERKDGSAVHTGQLQSYQHWVESNYPDYYQLFILSDSRGLNHCLPPSSPWIHLDDTWLIEALKETLIPGRLPDELNQRFEDLLYLFDEYGEYREPFYRGIEQELNQFALENRDILQRLRANSISNIETRAFMTRLLPNLDKGGETTMRRALLLSCRYHTLLGDLLTRDSLTGLSEKINELYREAALEFEIYDETLRIGTKGMQAAWEAGKIEDWPVWVTLHTPHQDCRATTQEMASEGSQLPTLTLNLDMKATAGMDKDKAKQLAIKHGLSLKPRWTYKRVELPSDSDAFNNLSRFKPWIEDLCNLARALGY